MEKYISAIRSNDLVEARKAFAPLMSASISTLIEARKIEIAKSVIIEGEEPEDDDEDEDKKKKNKEESDGKGADAGGDADEGDEGDEDEDEDD